MTRYISRSILMAAASAMVLGAPALAQQTVDVITVTAQKREQNIQDVPIAVSAYNAELLQNAGIRDIKDLTILVPGLNVTSTSSEFVTTARIRGIGTVGDNPGLESSVGIVIDGVPRARNGVGFGDLGQLERIEVLRGPQGTLFGRNTSAGLINIVTAGPEYEFGMNAEGEFMFGDYTGWGVNGSVTGPIVEDVAAFRLYAGMRNRDGFLNVNTGPGPRTATEDNDRDFWTIRGQLRVDPSANMSWRFAADYTSRDENCCAAPTLVAGPTAPIVNALGGAIPMPGQANPFARNVSSNRDTTQEITDWGMQAQFDWDFDTFTMTGIAAHRDYELVSGIDADFSAADIFHRDPAKAFTFTNTTFELRFQGNADRLDWMVGGFYSSEELTRFDNLGYGVHYEPYVSLLLSGGANTTTVAATANGADACARGLGHPTCVAVFTGAGYVSPLPAPFSLTPGAGLPAGGGSAGGDHYSQDATSWAIFTHNTFAVTDTLDFTFGLRYTRDEKDMVANFSPSNAPACDVWEAIFGSALNFTSAANLPRLVAIADQLGVPVASAAQIGTVTCLNAARDVFSEIPLSGRTLSMSNSNWSGIASLSNRFSDNVMGYVSYSRGYKSGGFNLDRFNQSGATVINFEPILAGTQPYPADFAPETVNAWEAGFKTQWFDNTMLLNMSVFHADYDNFQLNTFNGLSFFVISMPGVRVRGYEVEALFFPDDRWTLQAGMTYSDARYDGFAPTGVPDVDRLSGNTMSLSPRYYFSGSASYVHPLGDNMEALFHLDGRWVSRQNTGSDLLPVKEQPGYGLINARVGIGAQDQSWALELWGQNLTDTNYMQVAFNAPLQGGTYNAFLGAPRTVGVTLRLRR